MMPSGSTNHGSERGAGAPAFEPPHPGVHHPRGRVRGAWSPIADLIIVACIGVLVFTAIYAAVTSPQVGPVHSWRTVRGPQGTFSVRAPVGWHVSQHTGDDDGYALVIRRSRWVHAFIEVYPDLAEEVAAWGRSAGRAPDDTLSYVHVLTGRMLAKQFPGVTEGPPAHTELGGRPAIWSRLEFATEDGIYAGEKMCGMRATLAQGRSGVLMAALAPAESWPDFEPIALEIFRSISFAAPPPSAP